MLRPLVDGAFPYLDRKPFDDGYVDAAVAAQREGTQLPFVAQSSAGNLHSQRAIEKLGATREGVLRMHMRLRDGFHRDTVMYAILAPEWPLVDARLRERLLVHG